MVWWSFRNNFNELQNDFPSIEFNAKESEDFIAICDNRLDRAKTFLNEIALVLGFDLAALSRLLAFKSFLQTLFELRIFGEQANNLW